MREHTGRIVAIPAGLGRPRPPQERSGPVRVATPTATPTTPAFAAPAGSATDAAAECRTFASSSRRAMVTAAAFPSSPATRRSPPGRPPHLTAPIASRTASSQGNVVMTRPAVIVGAPPKSAGTPTGQRVRKAREDEGRGFGQGLISEKSLDEVILAYLSEDADEK